MPWFIDTRPNQKNRYCVVKGTREEPEGTVKCHGTRKKARAHMAALYASEDIRLETVDIPDVEILRVGTWASLNKGSMTFTTEDLDEIAAVYEATREELKPRIKIGHDPKQRIAKLLFGEDADQDLDGFPALGWLEDVRRVGDRLITNLRQVPVKLAEMIREGAYGPRSSELDLIPLVPRDHQVAGKEYAKVLTGLALLGSDLPAVHGLADMAVSLREAGFDDAVLFQASELGSSELSDRVQAAASKHFGVVPDDARGVVWVRDTYDDHAIVEFDGKLWSFPFTVSGYELTLGEPVEVAVVYTPVKMSAGGDEVDEQGARDMDLNVLIEKLGLEEDASEEDVLAKLEELNTSGDEGEDTEGDEPADESADESGGESSGDESDADAGSDGVGDDAVVQLSQRVAELEAERARDRIMAAVDEVMADSGKGVIAPAAKPALIALAQQVGPEKLADMAVGFARVNLDELGSSEESEPKVELSRTDRVVSKALRIPKEDFQAQKAADLAQAREA